MKTQVVIEKEKQAICKIFYSNVLCQITTPKIANFYDNIVEGFLIFIQQINALVKIINIVYLQLFINRVSF